MLQALPTNISTYGQDIDDVIRLIYWITGVFFVIAEGFLVLCLVRFRRRRGERGRWLPGDTLRSNLVVLSPVALVLVCDLVIEFKSAPVWAAIKEEVPESQQLIKVTGRQFLWLFTYPGPDGRLGTADDIVSPNELHAPVGQVVRLQLESSDVLHSFYSPALRLKQDVVPGRSIPAWFKATQTGTFEIACSQLCGTSHGVMAAKLIIDTPAGYQAWLDAHAAR